MEKTLPKGKSGDKKWKHLHMRGENATLRLNVAIQRETSPHAWRKLDCASLYADALRNISTCVEKTDYTSPALRDF